MWEWDYKESWVQKNWWFCILVLEKTLESPLDCKESAMDCNGLQPVHSNGNQSWIFTGRTDSEAETPILWPPDAKNWFIWKGPDAGKDWRREEEGRPEDNGWMASLTQQTWVWVGSGSHSGDGPESLTCCSPRGHKELDTTEWLNWTELKRQRKGKAHENGTKENSWTGVRTSGETNSPPG